MKAPPPLQRILMRLVRSIDRAVLIIMALAIAPGAIAWDLEFGNETVCNGSYVVEYRPSCGSGTLIGTGMQPLPANSIVYETVPTGYEVECIKIIVGIINANWCCAGGSWTGTTTGTCGWCNVIMVDGDGYETGAAGCRVYCP